MLERIFLIGSCGGGDVLRNGASAKNYHLIRFMESKGYYAYQKSSWKRNRAFLAKVMQKLLGR